ncbi:MAG: hypothetical protein IPJ65_35055 [Archangiaceae bacterium]|nr:hypothetical protein [Archangiaceae bacterium]
MFLLVYLRMYGHCVAQAFKGLAKNWWTLLLPVVLFVGFQLLAGVLARGGFMGGFIAGLVLDAVLSCYLYFVAGTVALQKMTLSELKKSFLVYFWSVIGLFFVIWVANLALGFVMAANPRGRTIITALNLLALVVLNPAPEVIYTKGTRGGMDTIGTCLKFLQESWIEWFLPNLAIGAGLWFLYSEVMWRLPGGLQLLLALGAGSLFHIVMLFRGHLFQALDGSTHRQRMFRYRNAE